MNSDLLSTEEVIWSGYPKKGLIIRPIDKFISAVGLIKIVLLIHLLILLINNKMSIYLVLLVSFLILIVIILFYGRLWWDLKNRDNTTYTLTNNNIIITNLFTNKNKITINLKRIKIIECIELENGHGSIVIGPKKPMAKLGEGMYWWPGASKTLTLEFIPDVRYVYNLILKFNVDESQSI